MKSILEHMTTMIILSIMMFVFSGVILIETEVINARNYHSLMVESIQNEGYYNQELIEEYDDTYNEEGFSFSLGNQEIEVIYTYDIHVPLLGEIKNNTIVGYAR